MIAPVVFDLGGAFFTVAMGDGREAGVAAVRLAISTTAGKPVFWSLVPPPQALNIARAITAAAEEAQP